MTFLNLVVYATAIIFVVAILARAIRIAKMPVHVRWELYPVPHEKGRAHYGGSRLEEVDWWTKPIEKDHLGELKVMIPEILFLKGVWEHNKKLWTGSFPLHFGLYLLMGNMALLTLSAVLQIFGVEIAVLPTLITNIALAGCVIGAIGSVIMLGLRMFSSDLSKFSTPSHFFNILMLGAIYVTGLVWVMDSGFAADSMKLYSGILTFSATPSLSMIAYWHLGFSLFFIFYLPFTHMTHFFTKYFTYHSVRWEDEPNRPGDPIQDKINPSLAQIVTWSAPHVGADGKKNWVDIATSPMPELQKESK